MANLSQIWFTQFLNLIIISSWLFVCFRRRRIQCLGCQLTGQILNYHFYLAFICFQEKTDTVPELSAHKPYSLLSYLFGFCMFSGEDGYGAWAVGSQVTVWPQSTRRGAVRGRGLRARHALQLPTNHKEAGRPPTQGGQEPVQHPWILKGKVAIVIYLWHLYMGTGYSCKQPAT